MWGDTFNIQTFTLTYCYPVWWLLRYEYWNIWSSDILQTRKDYSSKINLFAFWQLQPVKHEESHCSYEMWSVEAVSICNIVHCFVCEMLWLRALNTIRRRWSEMMALQGALYCKMYCLKCMLELECTEDYYMILYKLWWINFLHKITFYLHFQ